MNKFVLDREQNRLLKKLDNPHPASYARGVSLVEVMLATLVVTIITSIILRNYITEKQREVYRNVVQTLVAFDKGVYDASSSVEVVNINLRPILTGSDNTSGRDFGISYLPSQIICPLRNTRSWITPSNFVNDYNNLNSKVPINFIDPRLQTDKLDDRYIITAWYRYISQNPITGRNRYALFELEIKHIDGTGLTNAESDIMYAILYNKFCVDSSGSGHYALAGGNFGNTSDKNCVSSPANYYTVELQPYNCR
jgi:hypothetical protein